MHIGNRTITDKGRLQEVFDVSPAKRNAVPFAH